jgi:hypothetical protein
VRVIPRRKTSDVYTVTDAPRPMSEDVGHRQRRYLVSMGIRTACVLVAVGLAGHVPLWALLLPILGAVVLPYVSVIFANGGREPDNATPLYGDGGQRADQKEISGPSPEIRS